MEVSQPTLEDRATLNKHINYFISECISVGCMLFFHGIGVGYTLGKIPELKNTLYLLRDSLRAGNFLVSPRQIVDMYIASFTLGYSTRMYKEIRDALLKQESTTEQPQVKDKSRPMKLSTKFTAGCAVFATLCTIIGLYDRPYYGPNHLSGQLANNVIPPRAHASSTGFHPFTGRSYFLGGP